MRPPTPPCHGRSTSTSSAAELVPADPEPPAVELLELAGGERGAYGAELLAQLRAEHGEVRPDDELLRLDFALLDLLDAKLLANLINVVVREAARRGRRAGAAAGAASAPSPSAPGGRAPRPAELRRSPRASASIDVPRLRPAGEEDRVRRVVERLRDQHLPQPLGQERHHRRHDTHCLHERPPERRERVLVVAVEAAPRAADVPVREVVDERLPRTDDPGVQKRSNSAVASATS